MTRYDWDDKGCLGMTREDWDDWDDKGCLEMTRDDGDNKG